MEKREYKAIIILCFVSLLIAAPPLIADEIYMWVDEKGNKHITDQPPDKPAKIIDRETYKRDSPEEIRQYEQNRKRQRQMAEIESERQRSINQFKEKMNESSQQHKQSRRENEIERAKRDLEFEEKYQNRYADKRRNANSQWEVNLYDDLKKDQDKEVEKKRRKLLDLENK